MRGVDVVGVYNFACSLREVLAKHPFLPHGCGLFSGSYFPSFSEGLSLREIIGVAVPAPVASFPFLFGGTFIEGSKSTDEGFSNSLDFPSFSEGLSLRGLWVDRRSFCTSEFPFLFGGTFIEGCVKPRCAEQEARKFPFLFGGTFIEGPVPAEHGAAFLLHFPSFSEGLSLRDPAQGAKRSHFPISLPFRRDFH